MNYFQQIVPGLWLSPLSITAVLVTKLDSAPVMEIQAAGVSHWIKATVGDVDLHLQAEKVVALVNEARGGK